MRYYCLLQNIDKQLLVKQANSLDKVIRGFVVDSERLEVERHLVGIQELLDSVFDNLEIEHSSIDKD